MRKEEIQKLIDRYFEGETTLEEERRLYRFFQKDNIPAEFEEYTEMFRDFAAADNAFVPCFPAKRPVRIKFTWLRAAVSTAAIAAIVFGIRTVCDISEENALAKLYEGSYMIVDGQKYMPVNTDGNSVFEIPVKLDTPMQVIGDTVAMSKPHEVEYTLTFHSDSATEVLGEDGE